MGELKRMSQYRPMCKMCAKYLSIMPLFRGHITTPTCFRCLQPKLSLFERVSNAIERFMKRMGL